MLSRFPSRAGRSPTALVPSGTRVYAIGDVHGRCDLLERLLHMVSAHQASQPALQPVLVLLGDYVDRGPNSFGVMELLGRQPPAGFEHVMLMGNHEEVLLRSLLDVSVLQSWRRIGGTETLMSYRVPVSQALAEGGAEALGKALMERMPRSHLAVLHGLAMSWTCGDYFFCHAGVRPGIPLGQQGPQDLLWSYGRILVMAAGDQAAALG